MKKKNPKSSRTKRNFFKGHLIIILLKNIKLLINIFFLIVITNTTMKKSYIPRTKLTTKDKIVIFL
jgi:hypothetical protein